MVSTLTLVLVGILLYTVVAMTLRQRGLLPDYVKISGPLTTIHTQKGKAFLDKLARRRRFWRAWGNVGVGIALLFLVGLFLTVLASGYQQLVSPQTTPIQNPQDALVIPGINRFLPLAAAPDIIFGLLVGLVVHEGGHGLLCRVEDIEIDSMGVALLAVLPIGAFVEPDEESRKKAGRGAQTRMFAAGVTNNFAITVIAFALLFGPVTGSIAVAAGVPVGGTIPGSPAADAGLGQGDRIVAVNGTEVANNSEFEAVLAERGSQPLSLGLSNGTEISVERSLLVTRALVDGPFSVEVGDRIVAVNGTSVRTEEAFTAALENRTVATLTTANGSTTTAPVGAYATNATAGGPLNEAGVPTDRAVVITRVDDTRILDSSALLPLLRDTEPGTEVTVEAYVDGARDTYNVTLQTNERTGGALIGITGGQFGVTGLVVTDLGLRTYPADTYLGLVGGDGIFDNLDAGSLARAVLAILVLPFAGVADPSLGYNFAGFLDPISNFYVAEGPLSFLGGGVMVLANVLFWTGWVNFNLGLFNCIPAFPLDGGHILRASTEAVLSRTPLNKRSHVKAVTVSIGLLMLAGLVLMIFGPSLLG